MTMDAYLDEIKLEVTGGLLELEISDDTLRNIVQAALRELQRYICSTKLLTVPYQRAIDLSKDKINSVVRVYRAEGTNASSNAQSTDPTEIAMWQLTSGVGNMYNFNEYISRYGAYSTMQQVRNTLSTDLAFYYDDAVKMLYINTTLSEGNKVTIEYVPRYDSVDEVTSDFWIDVLMRLSKALTKVTLGRVRGRFTQSNALWVSDAETMRTEGNTELSELRAYLQANTQLLYGID